jgi:hypothetical protein
MFYTQWAAPDQKKKRGRYYLRSFLGILLPVIAYFMIVRPDRVLQFIILYIIIAVPLAILLNYLNVKVWYRNRIRKYLSDVKNASLFNPGTLIISDMGIIYQDETSEAKISWKAIVKKTETVDYIYLYLTAVNAVVIPKRILSAEEKAELLNLVKRNASLESEFNDVKV